MPLPNQDHIVMIDQFSYTLFRAFKKAGVIKYLNVTTSIEVNSKMLKLPLMGGVGFQNVYSSEPWLLDVLGVLVKQKEGAFVDVGVNIGQTLIKFLSLDSEIPYYGFDPNPIAVAYAEKIISVNGVNNAHLVPIGLSGKTSVVQLFANSDVDSTASAIDGFRDRSHYTSSRYIAVFIGDEVIDKLEIDAISVLKIDVEGGELEVLRGLEGTISRTRPFTSCEILPVYDEASEIGIIRRRRTDEIQDILKKHRYTICRVLRNGNIDKLDYIETHGNMDLCEYLFLPDEKSNQIMDLLA